MALSETVRVQVRFSEVDSIKMVWHGHYITYMEDAREAFGRKYGLEYMYIYNSGYLAPMFDVKMRYHQTATVDDVLLVTITCRQTKGSKLVFDYEIRKESDQALVFTAESTQLHRQDQFPRPVHRHANSGLRAHRCQNPLCYGDPEVTRYP